MSKDLQDLNDLLRAESARNRKTDASVAWPSTQRDWLRPAACFGFVRRAYLGRPWPRLAHRFFTDTEKYGLPTEAVCPSNVDHQGEDQPCSPV